MGVGNNPFWTSKRCRNYFKLCCDLAYTVSQNLALKILIWFKVKFKCVSLKDLRTLIISNINYVQRFSWARKFIHHVFKIQDQALEH